MNESPQHLKHSVGTPFWIGCLSGPILYIILSAVLGVFQDGFTFWFDGGIAIIVFGPVGGVSFQAMHDLFLARRLRLLNVWDFLVFSAIAVALATAGFALFRSLGKNPDVNMFKNRTFDIAGVFIILILLVYVISKNISHFISWQAWISILFTVGLLVMCSEIYMLTGFDIGWIMVIGTGFWAAIDSSKIELKRYKSGISYGPVILFIGFVFLWLITFPWYLIIRHKIKTRTAVLKDGAANVAS